MSVIIRPATVEDGAWLALWLHPADRDEIEGAGLEPVAAITAAIARSFEAWTAIDTAYGLRADMIVAVWGIGAADVMGEVGFPWMLTSNLVLDMPHKVARTARAWLTRQLEAWPVLAGNVDIRHARALRWLEWNGFTLGTPRPYGRLGLPYSTYRRVRAGVS